MDALKGGFDYVKARDLAMSNFGCHLSHLGIGNFSHRTAFFRLVWGHIWKNFPDY